MVKNNRLPLTNILKKSTPIWVDFSFVFYTNNIFLNFSFYKNYAYYALSSRL